MFIKFSVSSCPVSDPRYKILDNHCFYFEKNNLNFASANENCQEKLGAFGRLYEPNSIEEMKKVAKLADDVFKPKLQIQNWAWIGVTDKRIEGKRNLYKDLPEQSGGSIIVCNKYRVMKNYF